MHDRLDHHGMNDMNEMSDEASLAAALRALPASTPPQQAWRNLSARIGRRRTVRRTVWFTPPAARPARSAGPPGVTASTCNPRSSALAAIPSMPRLLSAK